jgi:hypothetical protein
LSLLSPPLYFLKKTVTEGKIKEEIEGQEDEEEDVRSD